MHIGMRASRGERHAIVAPAWPPSAQRAHPAGDGPPDLVRRIFPNEMDPRHRLLGQRWPPADEVDQPIIGEDRTWLLFGTFRRTDFRCQSRLTRKSEGEAQHGLFCWTHVSVKETSVCIVDGTPKIVREARVASEPEALLQGLLLHLILQYFPFSTHTNAARRSFSASASE